MGRQLITFVDAQLKLDSKLVKHVKQHKFLFDRNHKLFNDGETRLQTWKYISEQLGQSDPMYCEKRWVYIINRFYDEIMFMLKYRTSSLWLLFPQLDFLEEYIDWDDIEEICNELMEFNESSASQVETLPLG